MQNICENEILFVLLRIINTKRNLKMEDLNKLAYDEIVNFVHKFHVEPTHILMHPRTYDELVRNFVSNYGAAMPSEKDTPGILFGYKIIRSIDVKIGEIKPFVTI